MTCYDRTVRTHLFCSWLGLPNSQNLYIGKHIAQSNDQPASETLRVSCLYLMLCKIPIIWCDLKWTVIDSLCCDGGCDFAGRHGV
jgi:hypothetical protein